MAEGGSNDQQQDTRSQVMAPEAAADMPPGEDMPPAEDMQTAFRRMQTSCPVYSHCVDYKPPFVNYIVIMCIYLSQECRRRPRSSMPNG